MPTEFDNFTEKAAADYPDLTEEQIANREKLRSIMEKHGFKINSDEWWHYNLKDNMVVVPILGSLVANLVRNAALARKLADRR